MAGDLLPGENLILKLHQHWIFVAKSLLIPIALLLLVVVADIVLSSTNANNIRLPLTLAIAAIALLWLIVVCICPSQVCFVTTCLFSRSAGAVSFPAARPASQASESTFRRPRRALRSSASWARARAWSGRWWHIARERLSSTSIS